jgi:DNA modification methylase
MLLIESSISNRKRLLDIGYKKSCDCSPKHLNCMTGKEWIRSQLGVWRFTYEKRDIRDKNLHPATYPIALAQKCIELFTHKGELVLDPFVGSGTTLVAAQDLDRNAIGFDLKEDYITLSNNRIGENGSLLNNSSQIAIKDNATNIKEYIEENTLSLILTSPPYANLLNRKRTNKSRRDRKNEQYLKVEQYSQDPNDLGTMELEEYTDSLKNIYGDLLPLLKPKGHCVVNVPDFWWENKRIPLHIFVVNALQEAGYELRNIIIWDRTNIVNGIGIFGYPSNYITMGTTFEYLLDFWKPEN